MAKLPSSSSRPSSSAPEQLPAALFAAAPLRSPSEGETLFSAGEAGDGCYRLETGLLKVEVTSPRGEARIIALLSPAAVVGELSLLDGLPRSASVTALHDSVLRFVSREAFSDYVRTNPAAPQVLLGVLCSRLREANAAIAASAFLSVRARVARALLQLAKHVGQDVGEGRIVVDCTISQGDLAAMAGVARENASRAFNDFRRSKLVMVRSRRIWLNDIPALEREIEAG
jgi:CRP/FNR family transcriptional regulator, cyclic AMP receptor protein